MVCYFITFPEGRMWFPGQFFLGGATGVPLWLFSDGRIGLGGSLW
jgi:hypothetical protein